MVSFSIQMSFDLPNVNVPNEIYVIARTSDIAEIGKMPTSCQDLQQIGNKKNGFFSIMGQNKIQTVYCNFTKLQTDQSITKNF
jgi:hypothetical protein